MTPHDHTPPVPQAGPAPRAGLRRRRATWATAVGLGAAALLAPTIAQGAARTTVGASAGVVSAPMTAMLTGAAEVPTPGDPDGSGAAAITVDQAADQVCYDLRVMNIATPTAAHIHVGVAGTAGAVVVPLFDAPDPDLSGCVTADDATTSPILANPAGFYVNVHNADFPQGAVRGQLSAAASGGTVQLLDQPLRAYDSRNEAAGRLQVNTARTISLAMGLDGSNQSMVAVPPGASGALVRLTAVNTGNAGFLKIYATDATVIPATSALNWYEANSIVGADPTVAVDEMGRVNVLAGASSTDVVIDVVGYIF